LNGTPQLRGVRAAWCPTFSNLPVEPVVLDKCTAAVKQYQRAGLQVDKITVELPDVTDAFRTLFQGTFGAQLIDALPKWRERMDPGLVELVEAGRKLGAYELTKANMARAALWDALRRLFNEYELLLLPVTSTAAFPLGSNTPGLGFLYPFNLSGQPAASIPCGFTDSGLPVGLQIVGRRFQDATVLRAAAVFEAILPWADRIPSFTVAR
jgi:aspartyl-tRNA(Asn)/glutamyl-tRNA(Gln) amidotransferase subunit A